MLESEKLRLKKVVGCDSEVVISLGEWLKHLNLFSDLQIYEILKFVKDGILKFEEEVNAGKFSKSCLSVSDYRWISFTSKKNFFDVETLEEIETLESPAVTHIVCDITAMWCNHVKASNKNSKQ
jgi:hypothetical protein